MDLEAEPASIYRAGRELDEPEADSIYSLEQHQAELQHHEKESHEESGCAGEVGEEADEEEEEKETKKQKQKQKKREKTQKKTKKEKKINKNDG